MVIIFSFLVKIHQESACINEATIVSLYMCILTTSKISQKFMVAFNHLLFVEGIYNQQRIPIHLIHLAPINKIRCGSVQGCISIHETDGYPVTHLWTNPQWCRANRPKLLCKYLPSRSIHVLQVYNWRRSCLTNLSEWLSMKDGAPSTISNAHHLVT